MSEAEEQIKQISEAVLGFDYGKFEDIMKIINWMQSDLDRLRLELDKATGVIR